MAEALERTIPCEYCNNQININDWSEHLRQCISNEEKKMTNTKNNIKNETTFDSIPCEYCEAQINLNDWESHSRQCADEHKQRVEQIKKGTEDASMPILIPCEYCDTPINAPDWESHSRQCVNNNRHDINNTQNNDSNDPTDVLIPCEYCGVPVSISIITWHMEECAKIENQRIQNITQEAINLIPCQICEKLFATQYIQEHQTECQRNQNNASGFQPNALHDQIFGGVFPFPKHWNQSSLNNLSRFILEANTEEYNFVADNFHKTLPNNEIVEIERIQNRRWYRQYDAHKDDFIERYGKSTEQWLFHGCKSQSVDAIINDCFNRSHAVRCAAGQGIYFAAQASTSLSYTQPDANNLRHMFMARVLVGKTAPGNQSTRVCPPGFDTTGGGTVFVTYHDAQAYGEYLITFR